MPQINPQQQKALDEAKLKLGEHFDHYVLAVEDTSGLYNIQWKCAVSTAEGLARRTHKYFKMLSNLLIPDPTQMLYRASKPGEEWKGEK